MASNTRITKAKRGAVLKKAGRKRKNQLAIKSTLSAKELFAGIPEPAPEK